MAFIQCDFFSDVLGFSTSMNVILPQQTTSQIGLNGSKTKLKYPVLYLLHGLSDDHTIWMRRTSIERYVASLGIAVVMPNVNKSYYVDMVHGDKYGEFVSHELQETVQSFFPISDKREDNFLAGLSMGGYGAFLIALSNPAKFAAAASLSGALDIKASIDRREVEDKEFFQNIFGETNKLKGSKYDLFALSEKLAQSDTLLPKLYQCCGTEDFLYDDNKKFKSHIEKLSFDYTYQEGAGIHNWDYWDINIQKILQWMIKS